MSSRTVAEVPPDVELKPVIEVLDDGAFLPGHVIDLALWAAEYYVAGPGETVAAAMPPFAWVESERRVSITDAGRARLALTSGDARRCAARGAPRAGRRPQLHAARVERGGRWRAAAASTRSSAGCCATGWSRRAQAMKGKASAFRTVRVVSLSVEGQELAERA